MLIDLQVYEMGDMVTEIHAKADEYFRLAQNYQ